MNLLQRDKRLGKRILPNEGRDDEWTYNNFGEKVALNAAFYFENQWVNKRAPVKIYSGGEDLMEKIEREKEKIRQLNIQRSRSCKRDAKGHFVKKAKGNPQKLHAFKEAV